MRKFPVAGFRPTPHDLFEVLHFLPEEKMREALGINPWAFRRMLDGEEPVPLVVYKFAQIIAGLTLPKTWGVWAGAHIEGERLQVKGQGGRKIGIRFEEVAYMDYMRKCVDLCKSQTSLIERLKTERDFYKGQCARDAKHSMLINQIFKDS